jgi:hypothetical protein
MFQQNHMDNVLYSYRNLFLFYVKAINSFVYNQEIKEVICVDLSIDSHNTVLHEFKLSNPTRSNRTITPKSYSFVHSRLTIFFEKFWSDKNLKFL